MKQLPNNCRCGKFTITPKNWDTPKADPKKLWRVTYYFYDDNLKQSRQVSIKGMNHLDQLKEKQNFVNRVLKDELRQLERGYNPITEKYAKNSDNEITENTGLLDSLNYALKNVELEHRTRVDITNSFKYITISIKSLRFERMPVSTILPKHIKRILDGCGEIKTYTDQKGNVKPRAWGAYQFNRYRTYLSLLFSNLMENFVIPMNPVSAIKKKAELKKIRETTTPEQRKKLKEYAKKNIYTFYRFIEIYYHSSRRLEELMEVKKEDIYLDDQKFKITMRKGKKLEEIMVTIEKPAVKFWKELYDEALPGQYVFGLGLKPQFRDKPASIETVSKRWNRHMKKKLGITADLASLKHTHLDNLSKYFGEKGGTKKGIKKAQEAAGHSTPVITMRYLPGQEERNHNELKDIINEL